MPTPYFTDSHGEFQHREVFSAKLISGIPFLKSSDKPVTVNFVGFGNAITGASCYLLN